MTPTDLVPGRWYPFPKNTVGTHEEVVRRLFVGFLLLKIRFGLRSIGFRLLQEGAPEHPFVSTPIAKPQLLMKRYPRQTQQLVDQLVDGLWYWLTTHVAALFFPHRPPSLSAGRSAPCYTHAIAPRSNGNKETNLSRNSLSQNGYGPMNHWRLIN